MAGLPQDFINIINPVQITTKLNTVSDSDIGNTEITIDKFFIPTLKQMNVNVNVYNEEETLPY